ncbi:MarR family transcriptional regulator [Siculibacillus lacustris]|uniref:MarR family transcriptional regulator n=1 Tax=Siculibacillus lacustris TaxID=1549641 RepID=A0A4Q9VWE8_9HYPH|nr:MarR family transcriptional regulator [Siculibacillus lacustris]
MTNGPILSDCYCAALRTAARRSTAIYDEALVPVGINIAQFALMRKIARAGAPSLTELAAIADLDRSTIGRNVRVLERMGLVEIATGADQREATVTLAAAGHDTLRRALPLWQGAQDRIETALGGVSIDALRTLLGAL